MPTAPAALDGRQRQAMTLLACGVAALLLAACTRHEGLSAQQHASYSMMAPGSVGRRAVNAHLDAPDASSFCLSGAPVSKDDSAKYKLLINLAYATGYSEARKNPLWTAYVFHKTGARHELNRPSKSFTADDRAEGNVRDANYTNSRFDRGHMAHSEGIGRMFGLDAQVNTFICTNICPQKHGLNAGSWAGLEAAETYIFSDQFKTTWVMCGPIFDADPKTIKNSIQVPLSFYKVIVADNGDGKLQALAVIMAQTETESVPLRQYIATIDQIEKVTNLDLFPEMPSGKQKQLESSKPDPTIWPLEMRLEDSTIRAKHGG